MCASNLFIFASQSGILPQRQILCGGLRIRRKPVRVLVTLAPPSALSNENSYPSPAPLMKVKIQAGQDKRPENNGECRRRIALEIANMLEVLVGLRNQDPDDEVGDGENRTENGPL